MNTTQLECFLAVATHLNFAKAAEEVSISQPSVTHQIQSLETELNIKLFNRSTRNVELTVAGLAFWDDARKMIDLSNRAKKRFSDPTSTDIIPLKIGCSGLSQMDLLPKILRKLFQKYPNLHPVFQQIPRTQVFAKVEDSDLDLAIAMKDDQQKKGSLVYKELTKTSICCICKPDHPLAVLSSVSIEDMKQYKLILYNPATADPGTAALQNVLSREKSPADLYYCEYAEESIILVESGIGISILPEILTPNHYDLVTIPITDANELSFGLYYKRHHHNAVFQELIQIAKQEFS